LDQQWAGLTDSCSIENIHHNSPSKKSRNLNACFYGLHPNQKNLIDGGCPAFYFPTDSVQDI